MANNRMYLVHRPSLVGRYIGKRMGHGWYDGRVDLTPLYDYVESITCLEQDDFFLIQEDGLNDDYDLVSAADGLATFKKRPADG